MTRSFTEASPATLADGLYAFLAAEIDSPTERGRLEASLLAMRMSEPELLAGHYDESFLWRLFQHYRGQEALFTDLPLQDLDWCRLSFSCAELAQKVRTCRHHFEARYACRRLGALAPLWSPTHRPADVTDRYEAGETLQPPILVSDRHLQSFVILEGHNRLLSCVSEPKGMPFPLTLIVGYGPEVVNWNQW